MTGHRRPMVVAFLFALATCSVGVAGQDLDNEPLVRGSFAVPPGPFLPTVTTPSTFSLSIDGDLQLGRFVFQDGEPFIHDKGGPSFGNTAVGLNALESVTPGQPAAFNGRRNTAFGSEALRNNTVGYFNTAVGRSALYTNSVGRSNTAVGYLAMFSNTGGNDNTAFGIRTLAFNTTGSRNVALGYGSLYYNEDGSSNLGIGDRALVFNTSGQRNTAIGTRALGNTQGDDNTAVGDFAGDNWTDGDDNIAIGSGTRGVEGESGVIRIGGEDRQSKTYIEGISATMVSGMQVMVTADDQLGVATSSLRFKRDIRDLADVTDKIQSLRPVSFRYRGAATTAAAPPLEYGLLAEEVAETSPELVVYDQEGEPFGVRYHLLAPLLLAEIQRQGREMDRLRRLESEVEELRRRLEGILRKADGRE